MTKGKAVDHRLPNVGADFDVKAIIDFLNNSIKHDNSAKHSHINRVCTACGEYLTAETEDGMQIWYPMDAEEEGRVLGFKVHFKSAMRTRLRLDGWTRQDDGGLTGVAHMWNEAGDTAFPMNIEIVDAGLFAEYESGEFTAQVAAFGYRCKLFPDLAAYEAAGTGYAPEVCIPMGAFQVAEDEDWEPSARAIMSGVIRSARRLTNAYTGGDYYHLGAECNGLKFDVLLPAGDVQTEPVAGGYIHGIFDLTARLFPTEGDACLTPLFSLDVKALMDDFASINFQDDVADEPIDGWELTASPVMPDKGVLLIMQNESEAGDVFEETSVYYYRFLRFDQNGTLTEARRTRLIGGSVTSAHYDDRDHLHIVFYSILDDEEFVMDMDDATTSHPVHALGRDIVRLITDSRGNIFVGRNQAWYREGLGNTSELVSVYDVDGVRQTAFSDERNYRCAELLLDEDEDVWYLSEPILSLHKITPGEDGWVCSAGQGFPLSRCLGLARSEDGSMMYCECEGAEDKGRFYTLTRQEGQYGDPRALVPPLQIQESGEVRSATAKDRIAFLVGGNVYVFRLENAQCGTPEGTGRTRRKREK